MAKTYVSTVIDAPVEAVWRVLRDFRRLAEYHSTVVTIEFPGDLPGDEIGCTRRASNSFGMHVTERLVALSDLEHSGSYRMLEIEAPVANFIGHFRLLPLTDGGKTFIEWRSEFDYLGEDNVMDLITFLENEVYMDCLRGLKRMFEVAER